MSHVAPSRVAPRAEARSQLTPSRFLLCFASFLAITLAVYRGALDGPFLSDDLAYLVANPYVHSFDGPRLAAILAPDGEPRAFFGGNYAPLPQLTHALAWQAFGSDTRGHHLLNLGLHALNGALLVLLLLASGVSRLPALAGGALFTLHPANVEVGAWISQQRSLLALGLALVGLLLLRRRPLSSSPFFALALLSKTSAMFALPMAAAFVWCWRRRAEATPRHTAALLLWIALFALYAPIQLSGAATLAHAYQDPYPDLATLVRSIAAIGARYLVMAALGYGTSAYHEPTPVGSWLDPWWLTGAVALLALGARTLFALRSGREESAWWLGAAAGFAPVSQVVPFYFAMADRYLYFILPGLLGGALLLAAELSVALESRLRARARGWISKALRPGSLAAAALLLVAFALHAQGRATLWQSEGFLIRDAATQYPDGVQAHYFWAVVSVAQHDYDRAFEHLRASSERGGHLVHPIYTDEQLAPLRADPRYPELVRELAGKEIAYKRERGVLGQSELLSIAYLHGLRGELELQIAALEEALRVGGPQDAPLLAYLESLRQARATAGAQGTQPLDPPAGGSPWPWLAPRSDSRAKIGQDFLLGAERAPDEKRP